MRASTPRHRTDATHFPRWPAPSATLDFFLLEAAEDEPGFSLVASPPTSRSVGALLNAGEIGVNGVGPSVECVPRRVKQSVEGASCIVSRAGGMVRAHRGFLMCILLG